MKNNGGFFDGAKRLLKIVDKTEKKRENANAIVAITGLSVATVIGAMSLYDSFFKRYERPDPAVTFGVVCMERADESLTREEFFFPADKFNLKGYYYEAKNAKAMVVVSHGLHAGADDYLPVIEYFVKNDYSVFAYDGTGTYDSEGDSTVGMCQSLVDLDHTLDYIASSVKFKNMPIMLFGHSCGGYAVTSVLSIKKNISAVAAIAPVNNCFTLIVDKGRQYAGALATEGLPKVFISAYQRILFGKYSESSGVKGINSVDIPVLIAHGKEDSVISFDGQSIIAHRNEITNGNVRYYVTSGLNGGHDSVWHSERSAEYRRKVSEDFETLKKAKGKSFSEEDLVEFVKTVNHKLYSEVNYELMNNIIEMFNGALPK